MMTLRCVPDAIPADERPAHFARIKRLFREVMLDRREEPSGYIFRFPPEEWDAIAHFVSHERRCCPFLTFSIDVTAENGPISLRLHGPGSKEFVDAELLA